MYNLQTYKTPPNRWFVRESRPYDFLYDSTYTQPSREDFIKSAQYGLRSGGRTTLRPVYTSMFSGLKNTSRIRGCMQEMKPSVLENFMPEYDVNGVPIVPADTGPLPAPRLVDEVTGANRAKYAIRYGPPKYKVDSFDFEPVSTFEDGKKRKRSRMKYMNKSIQTDYRESECQTDPYSPPYFLPYPGAYPKLLALVKLTWEKGLPFSLDDIVIIERALSKRQLEYVDREVENEKDFEKRIKLMEELEAQQWADREKELDKLRQRKMELTTRLLHEYSSRVANDHTLRLERLHAKLKKNSKLNFDVIKHQYFRDLRKLERKYLHKDEPRQRDIIKDYTEFDSRVYAPLTRLGGGIGTFGNKPNQFYWNFRDFDTLDKITRDPCFIKHDLTFDVDGFKSRIDTCKPVGTVKRLEKKLEDIYLSFKGHGMKGKEQLNYLGQMDSRGDEVGRPLTPEIVITEDRDEELRKPHIVLLQKITRGRTIQKLIRNEIDKNMNEILGLKLMFDMDPNCMRLEESRLQKLMAMRKNAEAEETRDTPVEEVLGHLEGETLAKMIDFLDKEMVRLIDERKIHALILLAERDRKLKEAAEGGKRYQEEEARRANDEVFKHVTGIHQSTVDMYLEEIFLESCDRVADDQSRLYVQRLATTLNDALYSSRQSLTDFEQEELAADLVSSFMLPELHRLYHNSRIDAAGARFTKASEQVVDAIFSSHPVTKKIIDELEPVVDEHLIRGTAAVDGGVETVDEIITKAVSVALKPFPESLYAEQDKSTASQSMQTTTSSKTEMTPSTDTQTSSIDSDEKQQASSSDSALKKKDSSDFDFSKLEPAALSFEPVKITVPLSKQDEQKGEDDEAAEEEEGEEGFKDEAEEESEMTAADSKAFDEGEEEGEEEEIQVVDTHPPLRFYVADDVVRSLAAKSVQVEYDTELGQQVDAMYTGAEVTVDDLFDEVTEKIIPKVVDDSASDATLSDDSDD